MIAAIRDVKRARLWNLPDLAVGKRQHDLGAAVAHVDRKVKPAAHPRAWPLAILAIASRYRPLCSQLSFEIIVGSQPSIEIIKRFTSAFKRGTYLTIG